MSVLRSSIFVTATIWPAPAESIGLGLVGLDLEQLAQLHALADALGLHRFVALQRARVDADEAQLLHEGVDAGLEDLRDQRPVGIGRDVDRLLVGGDGGAVDRIGRQAAEDQGVEQFLHAHPRLGRAADDGDQRAAGDGLDDQPGEFLVARLDAVEVAGHHVFVDLDDRLDERGMDGCWDRPAPLGVFRHLERAGHAAEIAALAQGNVQELAGLAEHLLDVLHQLGEIDVVGVHLVDER